VIARIVFLDEKMDAKYAYVQQLAECNVAYAQPNVSNFAKFIYARILWIGITPKWMNLFSNDLCLYL